MVGPVKADAAECEAGREVPQQELTRQEDQQVLALVERVGERHHARSAAAAAAAATAAATAANTAAAAAAVWEGEVRNRLLM